MARISNTTAYPNITPQLTDYIIGTDVSNNNNTNTITLQSIGQLFATNTVTVPTLAYVTLSGNTTATETLFYGGIQLGGPVKDNAGNVGAANQVLVSNASGQVLWTDDDSVQDLTYGSIWIGNSSGKKSELAIGAANSILLSDGTTASWVTSVPSAVSPFKILDEGNGDGIVKTGRDAANYGNIGLNAFDASVSTVVGTEKGATGENAVALGKNVWAGGTSSFAAGEGSIAEANYSISVGKDNNVLGDGLFDATYAIAIGYSNLAGLTKNIAIGYDNTASGTGGVIGKEQIAIGNENNVNAQEKGIAIGNSNSVSGFGAIALGREITISGGNYAFSAGYDNTISNSSNFSTAIGQAHTLSNAPGGVAVGYNQTVSANHSFAGGSGNTASASFSFTYGNNNTSSGLHAASMGLNAIATADYSIAMGNSVTAGGESSICLGLASSISSASFNSQIYGHNSTISGTSSNALIIGSYNTISESVLSHIIGYDNDIADAGNGYIIGRGNSLKNGFGFAIGRNNTGSTVASSINSIYLIGEDNSISSGNDKTVLFGYNLVGVPASTDVKGVITGAYNDVSATVQSQGETAFMVGAGYASSSVNAIHVTNKTATAASQVVLDETVAKNYADDTAAAAAGVPIGGLYHTSGTLKIRLT